MTPGNGDAFHDDDREQCRWVHADFTVPQADHLVFVVGNVAHLNSLPPYQQDGHTEVGDLDLPRAGRSFHATLDVAGGYLQTMEPLISLPKNLCC